MIVNLKYEFGFWTMKKRVSRVLFVLLFLNSCVSTEISDEPPYVAVQSEHSGVLKVYRYEKHLDLSLSCLFFQNLPDNQEIYQEMIDSISLKKWDNNLLLIEYDEECFSETSFKDFVKMNETIFKSSLDSMFIETPLIVIRLH